MSFMKKLGDAFNKAGEKAGELADMASDKASVMAAQTKLKMEQQKLKGKIPTLYKELGEKIYRAMKDELGHDVLTATVEDYTKQLDDVNAEIVELDKKIAEVAQGNEEAVAQVNAEEVTQASAAADEQVEEQVVEGAGEGNAATAAATHVIEEVQPGAVEEVKSQAVEVGEVVSNATQSVQDNAANNHGES